MELKPGERWSSATCETEVVVVKTPPTAGTLECGGSPMVPLGGARAGGDPDPAFASGTAIGKRYVDDGGAIEVLVTKAGAGSLALDGVALHLKDPKPLPASD